MKTLPEPDSNGLVRVVVGLNVADDGSATVAEINDVPVPSGGDDESEEGEAPAPSADEMPEEGAAAPSADEIDKGMYSPA